MLRQRTSASFATHCYDQDIDCRREGGHGAAAFFLQNTYKSGVTRDGSRRFLCCRPGFAPSERFCQKHLHGLLMPWDLHDKGAAVPIP